MSKLVTVVYDGNVIHESDGNTTFTLNTDNTYLEGDIVVEVGEGGGEEIPSANGLSF